MVSDVSRVQVSINLSNTLIAAAVAIIVAYGTGGAVGAYTASLNTFGYWVVGIAAFFASVALLYSIYAGGKGIVTSVKLTEGVAASDIPARYDEGYFNKQAIFGVFGLLVGLVGIIIVIAFGIDKSQEPARQIEEMRSEVARLGERVDRIEMESSRHDEEIRRTVEGMKSSLSLQESELEQVATESQRNYEEFGKAMDDLDSRFDIAINALRQELTSSSN